MRPMTTACFMSADAKTCKRSSLVHSVSSSVVARAPVTRRCTSAIGHVGGITHIDAASRCFNFERRLLLQELAWVVMLACLMFVSIVLPHFSFGICVVFLC